MQSAKIGISGSCSGSIFGDFIQLRPVALGPGPCASLSPPDKLAMYKESEPKESAALELVKSGGSGG